MRIKKKYHVLIAFSIIMVCSFVATGQTKQTRLTVSKTGNADFKTVQGAINSLSDSSKEPRIIYVRNGIYKEKIYIEKHNIILIGEDREKTVITQAISRDEWRCLHLEDWGVATMNVDGNDLTLMNLTVANSYGFDNDADRTIYCPSDTTSLKQKVIRKKSHQMALRTMNSTRVKAINCRFRAYGGDTVSPWNTQNGMFYFRDCIMEGGVDFYCPRGWAYAENCRFITHTGDAAIWHDGSGNEDFKTVLNKCSFEGYDGFRLGRYHRDAQFFLLNCTFAKNMADKPIYRVPTTNTILWGERIYYYNCHKTGGDYVWFADNIRNYPGMTDPEKINANWVFGNKWNPLINEIK